MQRGVFIVCSVCFAKLLLKAVDCLLIEPHRGFSKAVEAFFADLTVCMRYSGAQEVQADPAHLARAPSFDHQSCTLRNVLCESSRKAYRLDNGCSRNEVRPNVL